MASAVKVIVVAVKMVQVAAWEWKKLKMFVHAPVET